jgi:hypothetical protein
MHRCTVCVYKINRDQDGSYHQSQRSFQRIGRCFSTYLYIKTQGITGTVPDKRSWILEVVIVRRL